MGSARIARVHAFLLSTHPLTCLRVTERAVEATAAATAAATAEESAEATVAERAAKESGEIAIIHLREPGRRGGGGTESYRGPPGSGHTRSAEAGLRIGFRPQGW